GSRRHRAVRRPGDTALSGLGERLLQITKEVHRSTGPRETRARHRARVLGREAGEAEGATERYEHTRDPRAVSRPAARPPDRRPSWIQKFERWVETRGVSGSTRNTYLSALSGMYRLARQPQFRQLAGVPTNPFVEIR